MNDINSNMRIAVILDNLEIAPWQKSIFDAIKDSVRFEVVVIKKPADKWAQNRRDPSQTKTSAGSGAISPISASIDRFEKYASGQMFKRVFGKKRGVRDRPVKLNSQNAQDCSWEKSLTGDGSPASSKNIKFDIILDLSRNPDQNCVDPRELKNARFGRWFIQIGEVAQNSNAQAFPGFHEVCSSTPNIHVELCTQINPGDEPFSIKRGCFRTFLWSWNENERQLRYKAANLVTDMLKEILIRPETELVPLKDRVSALPKSPSPRAPGPLVMALALVKCIWRIASESVLRSVANERWSLHIAKGSPLDVDLRSADAIEPPSNSYWADPFFIERDGRTYIFFEEFLYQKRKGVISVAEFTKTNGHWSAGVAKIIIERDYHMSYPFIFEHAGELYMIPESNADNCIGLWQCKQFPHDWQKTSNLMDNVSATDTTLQYHDGKWWMFTNLDRTGLGDHCSELHIYSSKDPTGNNWMAHPENPVVRDARSARMAGPLISTDDGGLVRPAQINERYYGHALALYQITELNDEHYREELKRRVDPDWRKGIYRNHHVSSLVSGLDSKHCEYVVVDACRNQLKFEKYIKHSPTMPSKPVTLPKPDIRSLRKAPLREPQNQQMRMKHGQ